jgi:hypothetical protein
MALQRPPPVAGRSLSLEEARLPGLHLVAMARQAAAELLVLMVAEALPAPAEALMEAAALLAAATLLLAAGALPGAAREAQGAAVLPKALPAVEEGGSL